MKWKTNGIYFELFLAQSTKLRNQQMNEIAFLVFFFLCGLRAAAAALLRKEKTNEDKKRSN